MRNEDTIIGQITRDPLMHRNAPLEPIDREQRAVAQYPDQPFFAYGMFARVWVPGLAGYAMVEARLQAMTVEAREYRVVYWQDGERKSVWVSEHELQSVKP